jgi:hypothetical protein
MPHDGFEQFTTKLYGTIFDLTALNDPNVIAVEFFTSWNNVGDSCDIVFLDWSNQSPIYTIENYHTTTANNWEYLVEIPVDVVPDNGVLGVFINSKSDANNDITPVIPIDFEYNAGSYILNSDFSMSQTVDQGDFLITLIATDESGRAVDVQPYRDERIVHSEDNIVRNVKPPVQYSCREIGNYKIKRNSDVIIEDTPLLSYLDSEIIMETPYSYQIAQIVDDEVSDYTEAITIVPRECMNFELGIGDWSFINNTDNDFDWSLTDPSIEAYSGIVCVISYSFDNELQIDFETDNWLISPGFQASNNSSFAFYASAQDPRYPLEHFNVLVTTDDPTDLTSYTILEQETTTGSFQRYDYDLSSYAGQEIHVAIQHDMDADDISFALKVDYITFSNLFQDIDDEDIITSNNMQLSNYPNPFNPSTTISYNVSKSGHTNLTVYNIKGQKVKTLIDQHVSSGEHVVNWNGTDNKNTQVTSGVYFYILSSDERRTVNKMLLLK